ncbi:MAG: hypothetical protein QME12_07695, partial [Nanoarchaeota archaeon]|nr:hypothetical protein [Nanoarchaeota archaeon]
MTLNKEALNGVKMQSNEIIAYYSRRDIQRAIWESAKDREVAVRVNEYFAKRPDTIEMSGDVAEWARKGATSFHISEERWANPLNLQTGLVKKQLDELRIGWDLIIDIDTPFWEYAKLTAYYVVEALKFHNIECFGVKFSGNKGFHISVPFEAFPEEVDGVITKDLFPESLRVIVAYLQNMIKGHLSSAILEKEHISQIAEKVGKTIKDMTTSGVFDPFKIVVIDNVLISSRHMFRAPYSLHEKAGLVSLPIKAEEIMDFQKEKAKPFAVNPLLKFIDRTMVKPNEASSLIMQAFDWYKKSKK